MSFVESREALGSHSVLCLVKWLKGGLLHQKSMVGVQFEPHNHISGFGVDRYGFEFGLCHLLALRLEQSYLVSHRLSLSSIKWA